MPVPQRAWQAVPHSAACQEVLPPPLGGGRTLCALCFWASGLGPGCTVHGAMTAAVRAEGGKWVEQAEQHHAIWNSHRWTMEREQ